MGQGKHLFIVNDFPPIIGGQSSYLYYLCLALPSENILVLAPKCGDTEDFDRRLPFKIWRRIYLVKIFGLEKIFKILGPLFYLTGLLRTQRVVLLHCAHVLSTGFVGLLLKVFQGLDYVVYTHSADVLEYEHHWLLRPCLKKILKEARHVVTNSQFTREQLLRLGVLDANIVISHPRIDPGVFMGVKHKTEICSRLGLLGKSVILSINRLVARKGNDLMLKAMLLVLKEFPEAVYVIYGEGPCEADLKALAASLGLGASVIFLNSKDGDVRAQLLSLCQVFVMPSRAIGSKGDVEGFGVVFLEAGAAGKPVVGGNSGGIPDAVKDGVNGWLVDPLDEKDLARAVCDLLRDEALAQKLGAKGQARVLAEFDYRRGVPELQRIFQ